MIREEYLDVENIKEKLQEIGWEDGKKYINFKEYQLIPDYYLPNFFEEKFKEINKTLLSYLTPKEVKEVIDFIKNELKNADEIKILDYLKYGIEVVVKKSEKRKFKLIDYKNIDKNTFFYLCEAEFKGNPKNSRPDITLFINGIPVVIIEAKATLKIDSHLEGISQIRRYEKFSPDLFRFVQFAISYGEEQLYTPTMPNWYKENIHLPAYYWRIRQKINGKKVVKDDIFYILNPSILLEIIRYFIFYRKDEYSKTKTLSKIIARYNQYFATKKAMKRIDEYLSGDSKNKGLIWHWQGSGKTYTMFFIANYFLDKYFSENPVIFFVVDRVDLERQSKEFYEAIQEKKFKTILKRIDSINKLYEVIKSIKMSELSNKVIVRGIYTTTIQKFQYERSKKEKDNNKEKDKDDEDLDLSKPIEEIIKKIEDKLKKEEKEGKIKGLKDLLIILAFIYLKHLKEKNPEEYKKHIENLKKLKDKDKKEEYLINLGNIKRKHILILIDEAHRTQYGILGGMRKITFPNAITFGFTGTPVFKNEKNTFTEFSYPEKGEFYLDVYFIGDSIKDKFTLPLTYQIVKEGDIKSEGIQITLDEEDIKEFIDEWIKRGEDINLFDRKKLPKYINKSKTILLNPKRIDKVAKYIVDRIEEDTENFKFKAMVVAVNRLGCVRFKKALDKYLKEKFGDEAEKWAEVVMTYHHNEEEKEIIEYMKKLKKERNSNDFNEINQIIREEFLNSENPKILIVTDMLLTGFDAPRLKVMYLDKPLYGHRLLQAIARTNRPYPDKEFGLIVDSVGLFKVLTETMALYNMLAEEEIREDFKNNLISSIDEIFQEFKLKLEMVKESLKNLKINDEDLSIDVNTLKTLTKNKDFNNNELKEKLDLIAFYAEDGKNARILKLIDDLKAVIKLYKALGSYPQKIFYIEDIELLSFIYAYLIKKLKPKKKSNRKFWEELISFIHNKMLVDDLTVIEEINLNPDDLDKILKENIGKREIKRAVANYYFILKNSILDKQHDPIYKEILERLERLRRDWIMKRIDDKIYLNAIKNLMELKNNYDKKIKGKSSIERIKESISTYIGENILKDQDIKLNLENTEKLITKMQNLNKLSKLQRKKFKKELSCALLEDLLKELKGKIKDEDAKKVAELSDNLVSEFILKEIWGENYENQ
ncbi:TPA: type I restriction endonuclease subunit R [Methanocaldococcus jannaschii]|uniref:type I site-specific deoxyribonuclease n=1 Tax=Methanocaldococcus jannaschii TaxID=2190 RepID=A0A832T3X9_9EURY|nr:type I restriction endonuclease subunit R [Methanocaldococcus jannaschii]